MRRRTDLQAAWNPNLLGTQPDSESDSDFDSSDSANDSSDEEPEKPVVAAKMTTEKRDEEINGAGSSAAWLTPVGLGSAIKAAPGSGLKAAPPPVGSIGKGGALKKSADGAVMQPRVVVRRQKMVCAQYGARAES